MSADPQPDSSAVRTALWRALHVEVDDPPYLVVDTIGRDLVAPEADWRERPDMQEGTRPYRLGIVARTRFVEDLVEDERVTQYLLLGAGLDTFAQRRSDLLDRVTVFEVDQPGPQAWKRHRLEALGLSGPDALRFVPVDFDRGEPWWPRLLEAGFDPEALTVVSSSGVSMYISKAATTTTLHQLAALPPGSQVVMTFMLPLELIDPARRPGIQAAMNGAAAADTPWISLYRPEELHATATLAGFGTVEQMSTQDVARRYLGNTPDGSAIGVGEGILLATR